MNENFANKLAKEQGLTEFADAKSLLHKSKNLNNGSLNISLPPSNVNIISVDSCQNQKTNSNISNNSKDHFVIIRVPNNTRQSLNNIKSKFVNTRINTYKLKNKTL